jgi:hypothetical protein
MTLKLIKGITGFFVELKQKEKNKFIININNSINLHFKELKEAEEKFKEICKKNTEVFINFSKISHFSF